MKHIILSFMTEKGVVAYRKIEEEGKAQSWGAKQISRRVTRETVLQRDPLKVDITVKIPRLAIAADLPGQIVLGLQRFDAERDRDYKMEVLS